MTQDQQAAEEKYPYRSHNDFGTPIAYSEHKNSVELQRSGYIQGREDERKGNEWILVSERLPEERNRYICWIEQTNDLGIQKYAWNCYYGGPDYMFADNGEKFNVTHWMPLPEPPQK